MPKNNTNIPKQIIEYAIISGILFSIFLFLVYDIHSVINIMILVLLILFLTITRNHFFNKMVTLKYGKRSRLSIHSPALPLIALCLLLLILILFVHQNPRSFFMGICVVAFNLSLLFNDQWLYQLILDDSSVIVGFRRIRYDQIIEIKHEGHNEIWVKSKRKTLKIHLSDFNESERKEISELEQLQEMHILA